MIAFLAAISMAGIPIASTGVPRLQVVDIQNYPLPKLAFFACSSSDFDFILVSNDSDGRNLSITGAHGSAKPFRAPIIAILSNEYAGPTKDKWRLEMQASGGHAIKANVVLSIVNDKLTASYDLFDKARHAGICRSAPVPPEPVK